MESVRIGVVGCGVMGKRHVQHCCSHPRGTVQAVADLSAELAEAVAGEFNVPQIYKDGEALINDPDVDGVILALPTGFRSDLAMKALKNGKHLLVEKPVAMNAAEVEQMLALRGDRSAGCCSPRELIPESARLVKKVLDDGVLGTVRSIHSWGIMGVRAKAPTPPPAWRLKKALNGGGILVNWGCYDLNFLLGLFDWRLAPRSVLAQTWGIPDVYTDRAAPDSDAETHFTSFIRCAGGEVITLERAEYVTSTPSDGVRIIGDRGTLHFRMTVLEQQITLDRADAEKGIVSEVIYDGVDQNEAKHAAIDHDFVDAILEKRQPMGSLERSLLIQQITDAIYRSAETGGSVTL